MEKHIVGQKTYCSAIAARFSSTEKVVGANPTGKYKKQESSSVTLQKRLKPRPFGEPGHEEAASRIVLVYKVVQYGGAPSYESKRSRVSA